MRFSKYVLLLVLFFASKTSFSQVFTVKSNEDDGGPTTLRYALLNIPANTPGYTINFELAGDPTDANRTIRLRSQLPAIPSNVTIDGSSQNWPVLGVSGAKIIIEPENANTFFHGLVIGQYNGSATYIQTKNVQIYGLCIRNFAKVSNLQNPSGGSGILIDYRSENIKIGASGKGNVLGGNMYGINILNSAFFFQNPVVATNISVQGNIIGLSYDGIAANSNVTGIGGTLYDASLNIGGDNTGDGNVIAANQYNINLNRPSTSPGRFEINVINNKIGTDYAGTRDFHELPLFLNSTSLAIYGIKIDAYSSNVGIRKNIVCGNHTCGISIANADFVITGNRIGVGTGTETLGNFIGIRVETGASGTIGGTVTVDEGNIIANNDYGVDPVSAKPVKITRNSFYCNKTFGIGPALNFTQTFAQVLIKRANHLEGKATPNAEVELFYTVNCNGICEGKQYIETVQAGNDGRWKYDGAITGNVTATASLLNTTTSQFSTAALRPNDVVIEPVTCNGNGAITITEPREGFTFEWFKILNDGSRQAIPGTQQITRLDVGSYEVIINDGCKAITQAFEIKDQKLTPPVVNWPTPGCGEMVFTFSADVLRGKGTVTYQWINEAGTVVGTGKSVSLPQGTYKLKVFDESGCSIESAFKKIDRKPMPVIMINTRQTVNAACGQMNGSIKGIMVSDETAPTSYKWYSYNPITATTSTAVIAQTKDLENVSGGWYVFEVTDAGACSPVRSSPMQIGIYNSVIINGGIAKSTTCEQDNGSIIGITITAADKYELAGPNGYLREGLYTGGVLNFQLLAQGNYTLTASNSISGCSNLVHFIISAIPKTEYSYTLTPVNTTCGLINGSISVQFAGNTPLPASYTWKDASGNLVTGAVFTNSNTILLPNLSAGTYTMSVVDINGCADVFPSQTITATEILSINNSSVPSTNDGCSLSRGAVIGLSGRGGILPYSYSWYNDTGVLIRSNQTTPDLVGVPAGKYHMVVKDATPCGEAVSNDYIVENPSFPIETPVVNDLRICYASEIMINVMAPDEGSYQLYQEVSDAAPIMENTKGVFVLKVSKTGDYQVRRKLGSCYSAFKTIHIEVTNDNLEVMNTITPNGDGMNDNWVIKGLPENGDISIKLYTRSGQLIYESLGQYTKLFDGRFRGKDLPAGVYYYKIDLRADCAPLGGSLTLLR